MQSSIPDLCNLTYFTHFWQSMLIYINDANFHYTENGMAKLLQESWIIKRYMYINIRIYK